MRGDVESMAEVLRSIYAHADRLADSPRLSGFGFALCAIGAAIITDADGAESARSALMSMADLATEARREGRSMLPQGADDV